MNTEEKREGAGGAGKNLEPAAAAGKPAKKNIFKKQKI